MELKRERYTMGSRSEKAEEQAKERGLMDVVFSWSIFDVSNYNLYRTRVREIPKTFSSTDGYFKSFIFPLLEETRADLLSNMSTLSSAPMCEVFDVKIARDYKPPKHLFYEIHLKEMKGNENSERLYAPQGGDLVAFTDRRPKCIDDLNTPRRRYLIAYVHDVNGENPDQVSILASNQIEFEKEKKEEETKKPRSKLFIVYLANMTTNIRIWAALNSDKQNVNIIKKVLQADYSVGLNCARCSSQAIASSAVSKSREIIRSFNLDESQEEAILGIIDTRECHHENTVKLIWGPPGTGKTRVVGSLLFALLKMKCRTLTCAPTNVAVVGVASRLMSFVLDNLEHDTYGLGDIVLFGNARRMKIDDHDGLSDVFLDYRVAILAKCFAPLTGWKSSLETMICLLEDPEEQFRLYLNKVRKEEDKDTDILTFDEFFMKTFNLIGDRLIRYIPSLYTHLPTCLISLEVVKNMIKVVDSLRNLGTSIKNVGDANRGLREKLNGTRVRVASLACLQLLKILDGTFSLPICSDIRSLCLKNTCLIFCTASTSAKLHTEGSTPIELLVIDEAAQLKECESAIPLQLPGLNHAIFVGDERQLPAMVQSKISEQALFGRSLFERLVLLGHTKHLLNVQYRMHPSISLFPNTEFYGNQILDGPNVKERTYQKRFLKGNMFSPFSFINVTHWKEDQGNGFSLKNMLEVAVVAEIVASLFKESSAKKQRVSVGCISPYKAQVFAIKEKLGNLYSADSSSDFSVNVNSVDGFQGSEEDVIIISTVRSNGNGKIGFLSNFQRTNVGLTRARYCLWVLGNEATLVNSGSVWKKLVVNAKDRGCFYNANEDKNLDKAIKGALLELGQIDTLFNINSQLFSEAKWKVCFSDEFLKSVTRIKDLSIRKEVVSLLTKLSSGWRCAQKDKLVNGVTGMCSMLMEQYNVNDEFILIWTVDILTENSKHIQVLKVWDILPMSKIPEFANNLNILFGNYTVDVMNRCQSKQVEGDLVVPMTWPVDSNAYFNANRANSDPSLSLASQLAALSLRNEYGTKGESSRYKRRQW